MGRQPIGKQPMTTNERQRRYLDKLRGMSGVLEAELNRERAAHERTKARVRKLETQLKRKGGVGK
jgi:hypothetical protein